MKAQIITEHGDPSVFKLVDMQKPQLKPGHVIVKVVATSVNQIDCKIRSGVVGDLCPDFPAILQSDVAGIVESVASDVTSFQEGDEVFGCAGGLKGTPGALAEYMLVDARLIARKPKALSMIESAALPLVGITAWEALFKKARLQKGQSILIHGGVGGVGHIAVQLAKAYGAEVFATVVSAEDVTLAKSFGAREVIMAMEEEVESYVQRLTGGDGFDVVIDTVGRKNIDRSFLAAKINGTIVTTAARSTHDLSPMHDKALNLHVVFMLIPLLKNIDRQSHGEILKELSALADQGLVKPHVDARHFTLETVKDAHEYMESGKARGKVVLHNSNTPI